MLRSLFWIVAVAFLLSGSRDVSFDVDGETVPLFAADNPALETSDRVIDSISRLRGICVEYPAVCETGAAALDLGLKLTSSLIGKAHTALEDRLAEEESIVPDDDVARLIMVTEEVEPH